MNNIIKNFIEQNIGLIEDNKWEEVYDNAWSVWEFLSADIGELTATFLDADIDPSDYLDYIPKGYLCG